MLLEMKTLHEECGGCPTHFTGETKDGLEVDMYLRNGHMSIEVNGTSFVSVCPGHLDGVCSLRDFKKEALNEGIVIDFSEAEQTSFVDSIEEYVAELRATTVWIEWIKPFTASNGESFNVGDMNRIMNEDWERIKDSGFVKLKE